jgi:hypothetical protein
VPPYNSAVIIIVMHNTNNNTQGIAKTRLALARHGAKETEGRHIAQPINVVNATKAAAQDASNVHVAHGCKIALAWRRA